MIDLPSKALFLLDAGYVPVPPLGFGYSVLYLL